MPYTPPKVENAADADPGYHCKRTIIAETKIDGTKFMVNLAGVFEEVDENGKAQFDSPGAQTSARGVSEWVVIKNYPYAAKIEIIGEPGRSGAPSSTEKTTWYTRFQVPAQLVREFRANAINGQGKDMGQDSHVEVEFNPEWQLRVDRPTRGAHACVTTSPTPRPEHPLTQRLRLHLVERLAHFPLGHVKP
jgi:hypothetical protein